MSCSWDALITCPHCKREFGWQIDELPVAEDTAREVIQCAGCEELMVIDVYSPPPVIRLYACVTDPVTIEGPDAEPPADHGGLND